MVQHLSTTNTHYGASCCPLGHAPNVRLSRSCPLWLHEPDKPHLFPDHHLFYYSCICSNSIASVMKVTDIIASRSDDDAPYYTFEVSLA
jgi:hypothetical protein